MLEAYAYPKRVFQELGAQLHLDVWSPVDYRAKENP